MYFHTYFILLIACYLIGGSWGQTFTFSSQEFIALKDLYDSTGGDYWWWLPDHERSGIPWDFTATEPNPCLDHWQGIECDCIYRYQYLTSGYNATKDGNLYWHPDSIEWMSQGNSGYVPYGYYGYYYDSTVPYTDDELSLHHTNQTNNQTIECSISHLHLINYKLSGSLPSSIYVFSNITSLQLDWNWLTGPLLLDNLTNHLPNLQILTIAHNYLTGILSESFFQHTNLMYLSLQSNLFSGSISNQSMIPSSMHMFEVGMNFFTGSLSNALFTHCHNLHWLDLQNNYLSGTIPESIGNCSELMLLNLARNHLIGSLPMNLFQLTQLNQLTVAKNHLTGYNILDLIIPSFPFLSSLQLNRNLFSGTIPNTIDQLTQISYLWLNNNLFTGSLPDSLYLLPNLFNLALASNQFHGSISTNINQLRYSLSYLYFQNNSFTGMIPFTIVDLIYLSELRLDMNAFTGTLPDLIGFTQLQSLIVSKNRLIGTIPSSYYGLASLETLFLQDNFLTGPMMPENTFIQPDVLINIDISNNLLTGTLAWELFQNTPNSLTTFVATSNLLQTHLSPILCQAQQLNVLVLNGIHTAQVTKTQVLTQNQHHSIPSCIFQLPNLQSLQLSGNGYKGKLVERISSSLIEISLSHNILTGTIPLSWFVHPWSLLDLSYNKITGTLQSEMNIQPSTTTVKLLHNRLSGKLPSGTFHDAVHLDVLIGNIFECGYQGEDIPPKDPNAKIYSCGTNMLNVQMYLALGFIVFTIMIIFFLSKYHWLYESYSLYSPTYICSKLVTQFLATLIWFRKVIFIFGLIALIVLITIYVLMSHYASMYQYKYAFALSSVFDSGIISGILFASVWAIAFIVFSFYINKLRRLQSIIPIVHATDTSIFTPQAFAEVLQKSNVSYLQAELNEEEQLAHDKENLTLSSQELFYLNSSIAIVTIFLLSCSLLANGLYVYTQRKYSFLYRGMFQVAMASGKLIYNKYITPYIYQYIFSFVHLSHEKRMHNNPFQIQLEVIVGFFTNIVAPVITETFVDEQCFYNRVFEAPTPISSTYNYRLCTSWSFNTCYGYSEASGMTKYHPIFQYSYQCSSSLMTNYLSVYFFMLLIDCFFKSIAIRSLKLMTNKMRKFHSSSSLSSLGSIIPQSDHLNEVEMSNTSSLPPINHPPSFSPIPSLSPLKIKPSNSDIGLFNKDSKSFTQQQHQIRSLRFKQKEFIMHFILYLTILLTFGLMFPPLALLICYNSNIYLTRIINHITTQFQIIDQYHPLLRQEIIHRQLIIKLSERKLIDSIDYTVRLINFMVIPFSIFTTCWYLFDIFGDSLGWNSATWITVGFCFFIHVIHFCFVFGDSLGIYFCGFDFSWELFFPLSSTNNKKVLTPSNSSQQIHQQNHSHGPLNTEETFDNIEMMRNHAILTLMKDDISIQRNTFPGFSSPIAISQAGSKDDIEKQLYSTSKQATPTHNNTSNNSGNNHQLFKPPSIIIITNEPILDETESFKENFSPKRRMILEKTHSAILHQASIDEYEEYKRIARLESMEDFEQDGNTKNIFNIFE